MSNITVNALNISDNVTYLVEELTYRNMPARAIVSLPLSTRPGEKLVTTEWGVKQIMIKGRIFSPTVSGLLPIIDTLQRNFSIQSTPFSADSGRTYTVNLTKLDIPTLFYQSTMAQYTAEFMASDPFAYGSALTVSGTTASGVLTFSGAVTISGSVFAEPTLTITPTTANLLAGDSGIYQFQTTYKTTGEIITVSGVNSGTFQYGNPIVIDYKNFLTTVSGVVTNYSGVFSRWEVGLRNFEITIPSGLHNGYNWALSYQPRYFE